MRHYLFIHTLILTVNILKKSLKFLYYLRVFLYKFALNQKVHKAPNIGV